MSNAKSDQEKSVSSTDVVHGKGVCGNGRGGGEEKREHAAIFWEGLFPFFFHSPTKLHNQRVMSIMNQDELWPRKI